MEQRVAEGGRVHVGDTDRSLGNAGRGVARAPAVRKGAGAPMASATEEGADAARLDRITAALRAPSADPLAALHAGFVSALTRHEPRGFLSADEWFRVYAQRIAHALANPGCEPACLLAMSDKHLGDICTYPDSGKTNFRHGGLGVGAWLERAERAASGEWLDAATAVVSAAV